MINTGIYAPYWTGLYSVPGTRYVLYQPSAIRYLPVSCTVLRTKVNHVEVSTKYGAGCPTRLQAEEEPRSHVCTGINE